MEPWVVATTLIFIYLLITIVLGAVANQRLTVDMEDFLLYGRKVGFIVLYLTKSPETDVKHQITPTKTAKEARSECDMLGFVEKLPKGEPIPNECMSCGKLVECSLAKKALNWYLGRNSA